MSKVSINLITWNGEKYIESCLKSVFEQTFKDFSLLIIDNGSSDQTVEIIKERYPHLKVIQHKNNIGFAKAHNQAIHWTKSDYILCLNQDVILEPNFLVELVGFMDKTSMAGAVTGKILRWQEGQKTKYIDSVGLKIFKSYRVVDLASGEVDDGQYDNPEEVFGISGAVPLYRRKALEEVMFQQEYLDEDFVSYKEDVDLAHRLRWAGWQTWKVPTAVAYHERTIALPTGALTKKQIMKNRQSRASLSNFYSYRNHLYFVIKNLAAFNFKFLWPVFWYEFSKFFYVLFCETKNLKAWRDIWRNRKLMMAKRALIMKNAKIKLEEITRWFG